VQKLHKTCVPWQKLRSARSQFSGGGGLKAPAHKKYNITNNDYSTTKHDTNVIEIF